MQVWSIPIIIKPDKSKEGIVHEQSVKTCHHLYWSKKKIDDGYIRFGKEIEAVGPMDDYVAQPDDDIEFVSGKTIVPGFIDVHSHGGYSFDSMDGNPAEINEMVNDMVAREGITSYFCTTMTQSNENCRSFDGRY